MDAAQGPRDPVIVWTPQGRRWVNLAAIAYATDLGNSVAANLIDGSSCVFVGADAEVIRRRLSAFAAAFEVVEPEAAGDFIEPPAPDVNDFASDEVEG